MKKNIKVIAIVSLIFTCIQLNAQVKFGIHAGLNMATMSIKNLPAGGKQNMIASPLIGGKAEYSFSDAFALEAGIALSGKGTQMTYVSEVAGVTYTSKARIAPFYGEIPVNALYKADLGGAQLQFFAGPYFGVGVFGRVKTTYSAKGLPSGVTLESMGIKDKSEDINFGSTDADLLKRIDFGLNVGVGVELNKIQIRVQYGLGLANLDPQGSSDHAAKNRVIGISLGYMFR